MNKICIYAICKNESKFVKQWLDSMQEADYIVVLDTGSTDGTFEMLQNDPRVTRVEQKVITPWRFDVARNESMKLVPEDANILFCTDLDELLEPGWGDLIRNNWNSEIHSRGHYRYAWSHTETGEPGIIYMYDKMHDRNYQWVFAVHEVLQNKNGTFLEEKGVIDFGDNIYLHHYPDQTKSRSNYLGLLELRLSENPNEIYSAYLLAREYGAIQDYEKALDLFLKVLDFEDLDKYPMIKQITLGYVADLYCCLKDLPKAVEYYNRQIQNDKTYREPYLCLAEIYNEWGLYSAAIGLIQDAWRNTYRHYDWTEREDTWNEKAYDILAVSYYFLDKVDEGIENALTALQYAPSNKRIQENYQALLQKRKMMKNNNIIT